MAGFQEKQSFLFALFVVLGLAKVYEFLELRSSLLLSTRTLIPQKWEKPHWYSGLKSF